MNAIEFVDLKTQQQRILPELERRMKAVLNHGQYIMGPEIIELEEKLAAFVGVKHCISASSGTDTLLIALMALDIGPGDEVITSPFTFIATGEMIALTGAKPVFVDIDPHTYNIDPNLIEAAITPRTKAIMPVSLYGQCADFDAINGIAGKYNLPVIEDGAQSFGATYRDRRSCALSTIGSTSFFPSKPLGCYGDGGALEAGQHDAGGRDPGQEVAGVAHAVGDGLPGEHGPEDDHHDGGVEEAEDELLTVAQEQAEFQHRPGAGDRQPRRRRLDSHRRPPFAASIMAR